jgi:hypothetical protein
MKEHVQNMLEDQLVEITLHSGQLVRDYVRSSDLIGIVIDAQVLYRDGGGLSFRVIPWSTIQDVVVLDVAGGIDDHRYTALPLDAWYGSEELLKQPVFGSSHISNDEDNDRKNCHVCHQIYVKRS